MEVEASIRGDSRGEAFTLLSALALDSISDDENGTETLKKGEPKRIENGSSHGDNNDKQDKQESQVNTTVQADTEPVAVIPIRNLKSVYETAEAQASEWSPSVPTTVAIGTSSTNASIIRLDKDNAQTLSLYHPDVSADEKDVSAVSWSPDGSLLATGTTDGKIHIWTNEGKLRHALTLRRGPVLVIRWSASGAHLLSIDCLNNVVAWDAHTGDIKQSFQFYPSLTYENGSIKGANYEQVSIGTDIVWIDNNTYAVTGDSASVMIYRLTEAAAVMRFRGHTQGVNSLHFDQASQLLASGSDDHTIRIWHGKSQVSIMSLLGHTGPVMVVRWHHPTDLAASLDPDSKDKSLLVSASTDRTVRVWNPHRGSTLAVLALHEGPIFFCEVSPDGKYLATGGADQVLIVWDLTGLGSLSNSEETPRPSSDRAVFRYEPESPTPGESITTVSWSSDSSRIFVGFGTQSVVLSIAE